MLSAADDYPIHQLPEPIAFVGTDRNFYDRYYFQGFQLDQGICFGAALGVYPNLNLMDAAFMIQRESAQQNLLASRHLDNDRMNTRVGPIAVEVLEPLKRIRIRASDGELNLDANLEFVGRAEPIQEPRFTYRVGAMTVLDLTRMTQGGRWNGQVKLGDQCWDVSDWTGTRDRSWGIRPIGERDPRGHGFGGEMQWYWIWAPIHFPHCSVFFHTNDDAQGEGWNRSAVLVHNDGKGQQKLNSVTFKAEYRPGTRQIRRLLIQGALPNGESVHLGLSCGEVVYKQGEGYNHPTWGHGTYHGKSAVAREHRDARALNPNDFAQVHLHALCRATLQQAGKVPCEGEGVVEQMIVGPHAPSGFTSLNDVAS